MDLIANTAGGSQATEAALLLRDFANTLDIDRDAEVPEALSDPVALADWLSDHGLVPPDVRADGDDLELARRLRSGLRAVMLRHHEDDHGSPVPDLDAVAALPLRVGFEGSRPHLAPAGDGVRHGLARLAIAMVESQMEGTWPRLKLCPADDCRLAFYDTSKNRSRVWCSMGECGNRQKTKSYRARRRAQP